MTNLAVFSPDLPVPVDDGACAHLVGKALPQIILSTTSGDHVVPGRIPGLAVFYIFTIISRPNAPVSDGWDNIPWSRGCTPLACGFRDHMRDFARHGCAIYGLSSQSMQDQKEAKERLGLPFDLLSDPSLDLARMLDLPTFKVKGLQLPRWIYKRVTLIVRHAVIEKVFYPVFPADKNAEEVLLWLEENV